MYDYYKDDKKNFLIFVEIKELIKPNASSDEESYLNETHISNLNKILKDFNGYSSEKCKMVILDNMSKSNMIIEYYRQPDNHYYNEEHLEFITANDESEKVCLIEEYIKKQEKVTNYVVIDSDSNEDIAIHFPMHCVYPNEDIDKNIVKQISRKFKYGNGFEEDYMYYKGEDLKDKFENVIFLDIDGVLNRDGTTRDENEPIIEPEFVKNLAEIVKQTNAEIIITSSWRDGLSEICYENMCEPPKALFQLFAKHKLTIAGATPMIYNGPDGRPLEVRTWLAKRLTVKNFLILDDENFWKWYWLSSHVITTSYYTKSEGDIDRHAGLEKKYIDDAIRILKMF